MVILWIVAEHLSEFLTNLHHSCSDSELITDFTTISSHFISTSEHVDSVGTGNPKPTTPHQILVVVEFGCDASKSEYGGETFGLVWFV